MFDFTSLFPFSLQQKDCMWVHHVSLHVILNSITFSVTRLVIHAVVKKAIQYWLIFEKDVPNVSIFYCWKKDRLEWKFITRHSHYATWSCFFLLHITWDCFGIQLHNENSHVLLIWDFQQIFITKASFSNDCFLNASHILRNENER
jgi:hypothetical protein